MKPTRKKLPTGRRSEADRVATATSGRRPGLERWLVPTLVVLLTVAVFFPALQNGFVNWDDDKDLLENPSYRGLGWPQLRWMFTTFHLANYRPLTWVTLGFDYILWGMDPFGYHLTDLLLHAVTALLFYFLALRLLSLALSIPPASADSGLRVAAGLAALFFSIHPLRVEAVVWTSARNHVLSGLFFLWSILSYLRAVTWVEGSSVRWRWLASSVIIYGLSLLSQPSGLTLPFVLLVLDVYPVGRLGGGPGRWFGPAARRVWWEKVPFLVLALGAGVIALRAKEGVIYSFEEVSVAPRLAQALYGLAFYLWKTVVPLGLAPLYQLPIRLDLWDWPFLLSGLAVLAVSIGLFTARRRWPAGLASWVCYVLILSPVLGAAQSNRIVADRYTYLACLGWAVLAGAALLCCWQLWVHDRLRSRTFVLVHGMAVVLLSLLGVVTWKQVQVWHDSETLWRHALGVGQESAYAHDNLGIALSERGAVSEAIDHFRRALRINPAHAKAHNNLGVALARRGDFKEAIEHYRQALQIDPAYVEAHNNLGVALARRGDFKEAIDHFSQALRIDPAHADAHYNLGNVLAAQGKLEEAIEHYRQALRINPDHADAHYNLGNVLAAQGKLEEAMEHYRQVLRIQPEFAQAHESLARALAVQGKREEAIRHYQEALRIMKSRAQAGAPR